MERFPAEKLPEVIEAAGRLPDTFIVAAVAICAFALIGWAFWVLLQVMRRDGHD